MYPQGPAELSAGREQLVSYSRRMLDDGLAVGSAGNMSVRLGGSVIITPSGVPYPDLRPGQICEVGLDGTAIERGCVVEAIFRVRHVAGVEKSARIGGVSGQPRG